MKKILLFLIAFAGITGISKVNAQLNITVTHIDSVSCYGGNNGSITVTAAGGTPPYNYIWNTTPVQTTATAINLPAGTYTVTVNDSVSNSATASATVCQPSKLIVQVDSSNTICGECKGQATSIVIGGVPPYHYHWSTGATTQTITNLCPGVYNLTLTDANGCTASDGTVVGEYICGNSTFTAAPTEGYVPLVVNFVHTDGFSPLNVYYWNFGDGGTSSIENPSHQFTQTGLYNVALIVVGECCGCSDTSNLVITVLDSNHFAVYPSPAKDNITIVNPFHSEIKIYNMVGQLIKSLTDGGFKTNVDISALPRGEYMVKVKKEKGVAVKKFVKE